MGDWIHSCVHRFSITYDSLMIADDYRTTLKVAFAFWALTVIGHVLR